MVFKSIEGDKVFYPDWRRDWRYPYNWEAAEASEYAEKRFYTLHEPAEGEFLPVQIREFFKEIKSMRFFDTETFEELGRAYGLNGERLQMLFETWRKNGLIRDLGNGRYSFSKTFSKPLPKLTKKEAVE